MASRKVSELRNDGKPSDRFSGTRAELAQASHMPGEMYTSERVFELEKSRIFMKQWLCVGRLEEIPNPGDYMTRRLVGEAVLIARDSSGGVVACLNMCLHRGVEVAYGTGNAERFKCPYHAWTYDISGRLTGAPLMRDFGIDLSGQRMPPVRTATWRGWIFIHFDQDAEPFDAWIAPFNSLDAWRAGECRLAAKLEFTIECNWKFIAENLTDWYHATTLHAATIGRFYKIGRDPLAAKLLPNGGSTIEFDGNTRELDPNFPFPKLPWLGKDQIFSAKGVMFPNVNFSMGSDTIRLWQMWPLSASRMHGFYHILLPERSFRIPDFQKKLDHMCDYIRSITAEDITALESLQRAAASAHYVPGRLSHLEVVIHHWQRNYVQVMDG